MRTPKGQALILAIVLVAVISTAATGYLYFQNQQLKIKPEEPSEVGNTPLPTKSMTNPSLTPIQPTVAQSDETTDWKTYSDNILAASFKYPKNWTLVPGVYGTQLPNLKDDWYVNIWDPAYGDPKCRGDCPNFGATIRVSKNLKHYDLETFIRKEFLGITNGRGDVSKLQEEDITTPNGIMFRKVMGLPGGYGYSLYTIHDGEVYTLGAGGGVNGMADDPATNPKLKIDLKIFDQILSTFKFN